MIIVCYLFFTQVMVQNPSQDRFQPGGQDMEGHIVVDAVLVKRLKAWIDPERCLHNFKSLIKRYL